MMTSYILSILGIVMAGVLIDIVMPNGNTAKYIKSMFGIFVLIVIITPVINYLNKNHDFHLNYTDYEVNEQLLNFINNKKIITLSEDIENKLANNGFNNIDIIINYSTNDNILTYNSCEVNLKNLTISSDKQHINKYEFIIEVVQEHISLAEEVIIFYE